VFIEFMLYFCNHGRENLRDLQKSDLLCWRIIQRKTTVVTKMIVQKVRVGDCTL
jgi:hypothetical protein